MNYTKIPLDQLTQIPKNGEAVIIKRDQYWFVTDDKCVLLYSKGSFQTNPHKEIMEEMVNNYPFEGTVQQVPIIYLPIEAHNARYDLTKWR